IAYLVLLSAIVLIPLLNSCNLVELFDRRRGIDATIPDFDFPTSITFKQQLSEYNIFQGTPNNLQPTDAYHLLELSSILYTDYAKKQRLVKVPAGTSMTKNPDGTIDFPDGSILVKTFYYYKDERDTTLGKSIIETRLLIKEADVWNIATYLWNDEQTDASLLLEGLDTPVNWITANGSNRATLYHVPDENECIACHQANDKMIPLGTTLRNLNRNVIRNNVSVSQIEHLQSIGVLSQFNLSSIAQITDYTDASASLEKRARAYMDLNCSHCHNPDAWAESAREGLDFRYETSLGQTGILEEINEIKEAVADGEMPFIGTTLIDEEGVDLIIRYIEGL
ncbi:MAG: hypothetical protein AAFP82_20075, partial [Bacteroidota bacterium]